MSFKKNDRMVDSGKPEFELVKLQTGERLLRLVEKGSGLALEKRLDPNQSVVRQKNRLLEAFKAAEAKAGSSAA
jgi:hypothetical protein